jgi:hypothetical protein
MSYDTDAWGHDGPPLDAQFSYVARNKSTAKKRYKKPEANVAVKIEDYLTLLGCIVMRTNAGAIEIAPGRWFHGVPEGYADYHACTPHGCFLAVETKAPKKGLKPKQQEYQGNVEAHSGTYIIAHSVDELRAGLIAAYGPQTVADWELLGRARANAKADRRDALMKKMGQKR